MKRSGWLLARAFAVVALLVLFIGGCENPLGILGKSERGIQGTVEIPGVEDSSGVLIIIERQTNGMTASVAKTLEPGRDAASKTVTEGLYSVYTDESGCYQALGLPEGEYTLTASKADTQGAVYKNISVEAKSVTVVDIVLTATGSVSGTVTLGGSSTGMVGTFIFAEGTSYIAAADDTGMFRIDNIPIGTYTIAFYHEGYTPSSVSGVAVAAGQTSVMGAVDLASASAGPYFVTYDANGATSGLPPIDTCNYFEGYRATALRNSGGLEKHHCEPFSGWNTAADGSGTQYAPGATFIMGSSDVTLYAIYPPLPTYSVTYDANGATGGDVPIDPDSPYLFGELAHIIYNVYLVRTGYTFIGWTVYLEDGTSGLLNGWPIMMIPDFDIVLYATWVPN